jgi:ATP-dependent helicase YprA (DUF1998 family)
MNLSLDFPDYDPQQALARRAGLEAAAARFEQWMAEPDSPVRAGRRAPARAGVFAPRPEALAPELRQALERRGMGRLYVHQAEAIRAAAGGGMWWW